LKKNAKTQRQGNTTMLTCRCIFEDNLFFEESLVASDVRSSISSLSNILIEH